MAKTIITSFRVTREELRAVKRFARLNNQTMTEMFRGRVVSPALSFDPRQAALPLDEPAPHRRTG